MDKQQITIDIDNLTDEEILLLLKYRNKKNLTKWEIIKKEPFYWFKDFRRALTREIMRCLSMYIIIKYGLSEFMK